MNTNLKTLATLLLAGIFATSAAWASQDRFDISLSDDTETLERLKGKLKMSCWLKEGDKKAKWTFDVPVYASSKHWMHKCKGFVIVALDPDGGKGNKKWKRIEKLKRCTEGRIAERNAFISYQPGYKHNIMVFDYCEGGGGIW